MNTGIVHRKTTGSMHRTLLLLRCLAILFLQILAFGGVASAAPLKHIDGSDQDIGFPDEWPDQCSMYDFEIWPELGIDTSFCQREQGIVYLNDLQYPFLRHPRKPRHERAAA